MRYLPSINRSPPHCGLRVLTSPTFSPPQKAGLTVFTGMSVEHRPKTWSNNAIGRLNREIKRRADVGQVFSDRASVTRLIGVVPAEQHE
jgi:hypothetical protein